MPQWNADARGRQQGQYQQNRYENQQGPMVQSMAHNYGRGSEADYLNQNDIMGKYREVYGAAGGGGTGAGGGGFAPSHIGYTDPFKSYGGYEEFSKTGGYSRDDIANMRSRGVSPIRSAYANANREIGRTSALQGGYSPNRTAALSQMARQQGQGMADATQNVEAGLAEARNKGRLAGLGGMYGIEGQRLGADLEVGKFNAQANMAAGASGQAAGEANRADQLRALSGMSNLYGTTPGMSQTFGNQLMAGVGQGGQFGLNMMGQQYQNAQLPGQYDIAMGRAKDIYNTGATAAYPWLNDERDDQTTSGRYGGGGRY